MTKTKYHLKIEGQRVGQNTFDTYFLMGVNTMPDGEVIALDLLRDSDLEKVRQLAKQQAQSQGCRVVEEL